MENQRSMGYSKRSVGETNEHGKRRMSRGKMQRPGKGFVAWGNTRIQEKEQENEKEHLEKAGV